MTLTRVDLRRAPGIADGFLLEQLSAGLNLIVGPNASGKSTFCRAVRASLWSEEPFEGGNVEVEWRRAGAPLHAQRVGSARPSWSNAQGDTEAPPRPPAHLRRCFGIGLEELLGAADETEERIARDLSLELSDGQDLARVLRAPRDLTERSADAAADEWRKSRERLGEVEGRQRELSAREELLHDLRADQDRARSATRLLGLVEQALQRAAARIELAGLEARQAEFPSGMERVPDDLSERRVERAARLEEARTSAREENRALAGVDEELARVDLGEAECAALRQEALDEAAEELSALELERAGLTKALAASAERARVAAQGLMDVPRRVGSAALSPAELERLEEALRAHERARIACDAASERLEATRVEGAGSESAGGDPLPAVAVVGLGVLLLAFLALVPALALEWRWMLFAIALAALVFGAWRLMRSLPAWVTARSDASQPARTRAAEAVTQFEEATKTRAQILGELGLELEAGELALFLLANRLRELELAATERSVRQVELDACTLRIDDLVASSSRAATDHRRPAPRDASAALRTLRDLRSDLEQAGRLREERAKILRRLEKARETQERAQREWEQLYRALELEPGDELGLEQRARSLGEWSDLGTQCALLRGHIQNLDARLAGRAELEALSLDELEARREDLRSRAERAEKLGEEIAAIEAELKLTGERDELRAARAALDGAHETLLSRRSELAYGALAEFLIGDVAASHRREAQPALLRRAGELLADFTACRYALRVAEAAGPTELPLVVLESGRELRMAQLSAGTRAQLRLALRIAGAESAEEGEPLPLFLDEALAISDAARFDAVVRSLGVLAASGRQLFYLTADEDEAQRFGEAWLAAGFPPPRRVELGEEVRRAAAAPALEPRPARELPELAGRTAEEYLALLGVPRLSAFAPPEQVHVAYLLPDRLDALRRMLRERAETVAQVLLVLERGLTSVWSAEDRARFELRARALAVFLETRRIGRGRPVDELVLQESPLARSTKFDEVLALLPEFAGDARALLEALRQKRVRGFHAKLIEETEEAWNESGHHDARPPSDAGACRDALMRALEAELRAGEVTLEELARLADWWWRAAEEG